MWQFLCAKFHYSCAPFDVAVAEVHTSFGNDHGKVVEVGRGGQSFLCTGLLNTVGVYGPKKGLYLCGIFVDKEYSSGHVPKLWDISNLGIFKESFIYRKNSLNLR